MDHVLQKANSLQLSRFGELTTADSFYKSLLSVTLPTHLGLLCFKEYSVETPRISSARPHGTIRIKGDQAQPPGNCGAKHVPYSQPKACFMTCSTNGYFPLQNNNNDGLTIMTQSRKLSCVEAMISLPSITRVAGPLSSNRRATWRNYYQSHTPSTCAVHSLVGT
jgi:hypothetical protein